MMMMAYSGQAHSSHPEARHPHQFATSLSSGSSPQWIPTARDRLLHSRGSSSFYAAAHSQPFVSSSVPNHSSGGFFSDTMSSAELTGSVPPARSTVPPMNRTLSLDTTTWPVSAPANDWSLRAADHASSPSPITAQPHLSRTMSLPEAAQYHHGEYNSFTQDAAGQAQAWDGDDRKAQHVESPWASAPAQTTEFQIEDRSWQYSVDASAEAPPTSYSPLPHVRGTHYPLSDATTYHAQLHAMGSPDRNTRKELPPPAQPLLPDIVRMSPPMAQWHDVGASDPSRYTSRSPVPSGTSTSPSPGHGTSPPATHLGQSRAVPGDVKQEPSEGDTGDAAPVKKKRKRASGRQLEVLNTVYSRTAFPSTEERHQLARDLEMTPRSVQIWFQNRRQTQRERRPMGSSPLAPNLERVSRREARSVRSVSSASTHRSPSRSNEASTSMYRTGADAAAVPYADTRGATVSEARLPSTDDTLSHPSFLGGLTPRGRSNKRSHNEQL